MRSGPLGIRVHLEWLSALIRHAYRERGVLILYTQETIPIVLKAFWQHSWRFVSMILASYSATYCLRSRYAQKVCFIIRNLISGLGTEHGSAIVRAQPNLQCLHAVCSWGSSRTSTYICSSMAADTSRQQGPAGGLCLLHTSTEVRLCSFFECLESLECSLDAV